MAVTLLVSGRARYQLPSFVIKAVTDCQPMGSARKGISTKTCLALHTVYAPWISSGDEPADCSAMYDSAGALR